MQLLQEKPQKGQHAGRSSPCLQYPPPIGVQVWVPAALFLDPASANVCEKAEEDGLGAWVPSFCVGDPDGAPGSQPWPSH